MVNYLPLEWTYVSTKMNSIETIRTHLTNLELRLSAQIRVTLNQFEVLQLTSSEHLEMMGEMEDRLTALAGYNHEVVQRILAKPHLQPLLEQSLDQSELRKSVLAKLEELKLVLQSEQIEEGCNSS